MKEVIRRRELDQAVRLHFDFGCFMRNWKMICELVIRINILNTKRKYDITQVDDRISKRLWELFCNGAFHLSRWNFWKISKFSRNFDLKVEVGSVHWTEDTVQTLVPFIFWYPIKMEPSQDFFEILSSLSWSIQVSFWVKLRESIRTKGNQTPETSELEVIVRHHHYSVLSFYELKFSNRSKRSTIATYFLS